MPTLAADVFTSPWTFVITAAWDSKAIEKQSMDYKLTMTKDPCMPKPTKIEKDEMDKKFTFNYYLRGSMATTWDWKPIVFDKANLCPEFAYTWTHDKTADSSISGDKSKYSSSIATIDWSNSKLTIRPRTIPLHYHGGKYVFTGVPKDQDGNFMDASAGYKITVTVNLIDPCSATKDPNNKEPKEWVYIIGSGPKDLV